jgi:acetylornithine/N-succinyldiaminopimelate aminotransferase
VKGQPERIDIIGFDGSFHGRTLAAVNASGNASYLEGFGPPMPGFVHAQFGDLDALKEMVGPTTAAIILEPVQGEGGARSWSETELKAIRQLCDETGTLLIYDEIQCGLGRTGKLFAYEWADGAADPDIMAVAKALGGGFPVGACLATAEAASGMTPGSHGSTYGGNPLAMAVGVASVEELVKPELLAHVREVAGYLNQQLSGLKDRYPDVVVDIRGKGLLIGVKLATPNREFMQHARDNHLLIAGGGDNCVRLLPPLTLSLDEAREAIGLLEKSCEAAQAKAAQEKVGAK